MLTGNQRSTRQAQALTNAGGFPERGSHSLPSALISGPPADVRAFCRLAGAIGAVGVTGGAPTGLRDRGEAQNTGRGGEASTPCAQGWRVPRLRQAVLKAHLYLGIG